MLLKKEIVSLSWITAATAFRPANPAPAVRSSVHFSSSAAGQRRRWIGSRTIRSVTTTDDIHNNNTNNSNGTNMATPKYWNREEWKPSSYSGPVVQPARILSLADPNDPNNIPLHKGDLPEGAQLLAIGTCLEEFDIPKLTEVQPNVLFVSHPKARQPLAQLLQTFPSIQWVHTRSAGIDFCTSSTLAEFATLGKIQVTNAKGCFSSTLAEYTMMACSYFAKDLPRLLQQKQNSNWQQYPILELRGATLGIIGYGDIGRATAKLAKAYGMKVIALRRNPQQSQNDPFVDKVYGHESLNQIFAESDYILCSAPLTPETEKMIGKEQFDHAKQTTTTTQQVGRRGSAVFINVGRGPIVDEPALIEALMDGRLKGAGLDVTTIEPLPKDSMLWKLDNVLLSPHNMDMTETFMRESTEFFVRENLPRFLYGHDLLNPVNPAAGY